MDLGRDYQLGSFVPLFFQSVDGNDAPTWPSSTPTIKTFAADDVTTAIETIRPPARDVQRQTGLFYYNLRLSSSYTTKPYIVTFNWTISGTTYASAAMFTVVAGGDADGAVIGAHYLRRPEAPTVAYIVDGGKLKIARNPR